MPTRCHPAASFNSGMPQRLEYRAAPTSGAALALGWDFQVFIGPFAFFLALKLALFRGNWSSREICTGAGEWSSASASVVLRN